ncbi:hypothetical protein [Microbacterium caowuchunii]|uniref:LysM domain-containing protein n=1 Tax=Microbacterium caowuchunii TaxID=2614638 RepID=A0A5N0TF20_9MICO|nr:hypothetical protein [Microbacterium caowuchunii]KAA9133743.1 hypothetical protein F6B40_08295 [Microbacterium caowuchunii]
MKLRTPIPLALSALLLVGLTSCATPNDDDAASAEETPTVVAELTPSAAEESPAVAEPAAAPEPVYASCSEFSGHEDAHTYEGTLNGLVPKLLVDSGPRSGAEGETRTNADGQPVAYIAAEGDRWGAIAERFCTGANPEYLEWLNFIRRTGLYSSGGQTPATVYAGDTINLDPYTIASVGDENGTVHSFDPFFPIPPQR